MGRNEYTICDISLTEILRVSRYLQFPGWGRGGRVDRTGVVWGFEIDLYFQDNLDIKITTAYTNISET